MHHYTPHKWFGFFSFIVVLAVSHPVGGVTKHVIQERDGREIRSVYIQRGDRCSDICPINYNEVLACESLDKELQLFPSPF